MDRYEQWEPDDVIDLREAWNVIMRRKWPILALAGIVTLVVVGCPSATSAISRLVPPMSQVMILR